jgi:hypothetical protein
VELTSARELERVAGVAKQQARIRFGFCAGEAFSSRSSSSLVQLRYQLDPSNFNARRVRDVISLMDDDVDPRN